MSSHASRVWITSGWWCSRASASGPRKCRAERRAASARSGSRVRTRRLRPPRAHRATPTIGVDPVDRVVRVEADGRPHVVVVDRNVDGRSEIERVGADGDDRPPRPRAASSVRSCHRASVRRRGGSGCRTSPRSRLRSGLAAGEERRARGDRAHRVPAPAQRLGTRRSDTAPGSPSRSHIAWAVGAIAGTASTATIRSASMASPSTRPSNARRRFQGSFASR